MVIMWLKIRTFRVFTKWPLAVLSVSGIVQFCAIDEKPILSSCITIVHKNGTFCALYTMYAMLKIPFLHSTVCKLCKIGIKLSNLVKPVVQDREGYPKRVPMLQSSPQGQQMANSG